MNYKHECLILNLVLLLLKSKDYGHYNDKKALITERNIFTGKRKFMGLNWSKIYALPIQLTNAK